MSFQKRILIALAIIIVDFAVFFVPVTAIVIAYCVVMRPPWLKTWIDKLYSDTNQDQQP